eukprot:scaffold18079_cov76-Amphora_coffeaeformis.AAC.1
MVPIERTLGCHPSCYYEDCDEALPRHALGSLGNTDAPDGTSETLVFSSHFQTHTLIVFLWSCHMGVETGDIVYDGM